MASSAAKAPFLWQRGHRHETLSQETAAPAIVAPQVLLSNHLKALKLPTFAREYEKVAMELAQDRADYPRYLLRLCELELIFKNVCLPCRTILPAV